MDVVERINKLREERLAREKARIDRLRQMNLQKYSKPANPAAMKTVPKRPLTAPSVPKPTTKDISKPKLTNLPPKEGDNKPNVSKNVTVNKVPTMTRKPLVSMIQKPSNASTTLKNEKNQPNMSQTNQINKKPTNAVPEKKPSSIPTNFSRKSIAPKPNLTRKSLAPPSNLTTKSAPPSNMTRKSLAPIKQTLSKPAANDSVFDRLYKPKPIQNTNATDIEKLQTDPNYLKKVIKTTGLILNKRHTVFETKPQIAVPVRRSISAVHFKRISKQELGNCIHKWSSIGDKLNKVHLKHLNEDESVNQDKVISAVKSERKKVKFMTPVPNINTPTPEELKSRLVSWLQKRGKSLDSYHHLQCFGLHHLPNPRFNPKFYDDEDKENIAVESDSDDDSYTENMNEEPKNLKDEWRTASVVSDSVDFNETQNSMTTCSDVINTDEVLVGALNDLTELLKEGYDWEQCARWLRAIRERFPAAPHAAAYWECRAALEERRGDLPASVQCWEEAIAKGTEHSVVEANLDQLLDKFMQLKISPNSGKSRKQVDPKLVDVKNVFKSTIIRFAVQQAKLRQSNQFSPAPKYTVTPVRRSGRLSMHCGTRTPLQICSSVKQADEIIGQKLLFVPNNNLHGTP
ncbi:uncharacterized protein LOC142984761 [Anticarsia gemmatalis]|uniref:uncharacterized protein LOC142984761 n=1 Tax=Anticarsia gemmatalis TaxID=129554 RepID=UPI003F761066